MSRQGGVAADDGRTVAPEFQNGLPHVFRAGDLYFLPRLGTPGKCDQTRHRVTHQKPPRTGTGPGHHVEDPRRQTFLHRKLCEPDGTERCMLIRFRDDGTPDREGRSQLARQCAQRIIVRGYRCHHPHRFTHDKNLFPGVSQKRNPTFLTAAFLSKVIEEGGRVQHFIASGFQGLSNLPADQVCQLVHFAAKPPRHRVQHFSPANRGQQAPLREALAGALNRGIHESPLGVYGLPELIRRGRIDERIVLPTVLFLSMNPATTR